MTSIQLPTFTFDDNILGNYNSPSYHIRFYTLGDTLQTGSQNISVNGQNVNLANSTGVTIAETGVTGYNIKEFVYECFYSYGKDQRNTIKTSFTLVINEPQGSSLLDAMYVATTTMGTQNWQRAPYYIDITFRGYNEDGSLNTNLCSNFPNGGTWTLQLLITDCDIDIQVTGTVYTFTGVIQDQQALDIDVLRTTAPFAVSGTQLSDYFASLQNALNQQNAKQYQVSQSQSSTSGQSSTSNQLVTYVINPIVVNGIDPGQFYFTTNDQLDPKRNCGYYSGTRTQQTDNIPAGMAITDIIQNAIASTEQGKNYAVCATGQPMTDLGNNGAYRCSGMFRVYPTVTLNGYDQVTQTYMRVVTFNIKFFKLMNNFLQTAEITNQSNAVAQLNDINSYNGLRKVYYIQYTGLNTEVLEFHPKINFTYALNLPAFNGYGSSPQGYEQTSFYSASKRYFLDQYLAEASQLAQNTTSQNTNTSTGQTVGGGGANTATSATATATATGTSSTTTAVYAEDLIDITTSGALYPTSIRQLGTAATKALGGGMCTQWGRGRSIFGAILQQTQVANQLWEADIKIKGDPYWLGLDYTTMVTGTNTSSSTTSSANSSTSTNPLQGGSILPDFSAGDNCFLVNFQYPYTTNEQGMPVLKPNQSFNGVYKAISGTHTFSSGQYTIQLHGQRMPNIPPEIATQLATQNTSTVATNIVSSNNSNPTNNTSGSVSGSSTLNT